MQKTHDKQSPCSSLRTLKDSTCTKKYQQKIDFNTKTGLCKHIHMGNTSINNVQNAFKGKKRPQNRGRKRITYLVNNVMVVTNAIHRKPTIDDGGHEEPKTSSMVRRIGRQKKTVMVKKWTISKKQPTYIRYGCKRSRHSKECVAWHIASIDVTPQRTRKEHV